MYSEPKHKFIDWFRQKQRHLSTGRSYSNRFKLLLGSFSISQVLFYVTLIILLLCKTLLIATLSVMIITILSRIIITKKSRIKVR